MRRRSTFVHDPAVSVDPHQLSLSGDRFFINNLRAAREERLTLGLDESPEELWQVLRQSHELHIRWASEHAYDAIPPFVSRTSPGLHIFYTPLQGQSGDLLCPLLRKVFSPTLKCQSPLVTFTRPHLVSGRFASTSSLQYHSMLPSLMSLTRYIQRHICKRSNEHCIHSASLLNIADTVDIDYDSISHTLTLTAHWSRPPSVFYEPLSGNVTENAWSMIVDSSSGAEKVEVGVLSNETPTDPSEINLSGFLTVVGEDDRPKPSLFSFPSRHHALPPAQSQSQGYTISFLQPTGLHPTMQISFPSAAAIQPPSNMPIDSLCALHTYLTLPSALFADKYQLSSTDTLFLQSHHLVALRSISGETDLEAPDYVVRKWGSNLLLELAIPASPSTTTATTMTTNPTEEANRTEGWTITIPLHLRYLAPSPSEHIRIEIPYPILFWACTAEEGGKFPVNPFDRVNLGYEGLFGSRTMFFHLKPSPSSAAGGLIKNGFGNGDGGGKRLVLGIQVPVMDLQRWASGWVEWGTVMAVLLGFGWVAWRLWKGATPRTESRSGSGTGPRQAPQHGRHAEGKDKKKEQ